MNKKEISQCYWLSREIGQLEKELIELNGKEYKETDYSGMPHGSGVSDCVSKLATDRAYLHELILLKLKELMLARTRIETFINTVEDSEMRMILRLRHINGMSWQQIAFSINGNNKYSNDESVPRKKYNRFMEGKNNG